jgi:ParB family protein of integrating conjugative element (PFGI_1 class)
MEMADKLLVEGFAPGMPAVALSDPIADTPIVVTLDELRPYELNPRLTKNPLYDDIKASIKERGLDAPPPVTRRPGADHYIIRNGGNTRLAVLNELWSETKDERFFRIPCLFRPWAGEIVALTGHLAENELHGSLTFIERALGVEKARELYEQESDKPLSQSELARRLSADGYPVAQPHISRMQDTVRYLLPAIPNVLYGGLGRPQVERLGTLRRTAELAWRRYAHEKAPAVDYETLFQDVLAGFDALPEEFTVERVQDALIGQMARALGVGYNTLGLDLDDVEQTQRILARPLRRHDENVPAVDPLEVLLAKIPEEDLLSEWEEEDGFLPSPGTHATKLAGRGAGEAPAGNLSMAVRGTASDSTPIPDSPTPPSSNGDPAPHGPERIVPPSPGADRLEAIQQMVAEHAGGQDFADPAFCSPPAHTLPAPADGLFPVTDVWRIEPGIDTPEPLRLHIAQFAREIAAEARLAECVEPVNTGIGFVCTLPAPDDALSGFGRSVLSLLRALSRDEEDDAPEFLQLDETLGRLLRGRLVQSAGEDSNPAPAPDSPRLSDTGLIKLFRLLRLARRLLDLRSGADCALQD